MGIERFVPGAATQDEYADLYKWLQIRKLTVPKKASCISLFLQELSASKEVYLGIESSNDHEQHYIVGF